MVLGRAWDKPESSIFLVGASRAAVNERDECCPVNFPSTFSSFDAELRSSGSRNLSTPPGRSNFQRNIVRRFVPPRPSEFSKFSKKTRRVRNVLRRASA